ncbi:MAG: choice-of-anchor L domain-containing protein [Solirubrobacteraceae bacterium]|jgi:hypothetical protein|nr:choice-of-anchor L domain-containing protein [Solirubrobacteraceae bacterium]
MDQHPSRRRIVPALAAGLALLAPAPAGAAITPTRSAGDLASALTEGGSAQVTGASFVTIPPNGNPAAVSDVALAGFPKQGGRYVILSSGDAAAAQNASQGAGASLSLGAMARTPAGSDRDATVLKLDLKVPSGANCVTFAFRFASEEFPEYVGRQYNDAFIAELGTTTWTTSASAITAPGNFAFDPANNVVSINATGPATVAPAEAAGTVYDAATQILRASTTVTPGTRSLFLSIFDQGDGILDSTVLLDDLIVGAAAPGACKAGVTTGPAPVQPGGLPPAFGPNGVISVPSNKKCVSRRKFRIRIRKRKNLKYETAIVFVNKKRVRVVKGRRLTAPVDLRGLPKGRFTVQITVITTTGAIISGKRTYRTCAPKRTTGKTPNL